MFDSAIRDLPLIANNMRRLAGGVAVDFKVGYIRMVRGQMRYDRKFKLKDTTTNTIYVVKNNILEVYTSSNLEDPSHLRRTIKAPRSTGDLSPTLFKDEEDRKHVCNFIVFVNTLNEEQLHRDSPLTKFREWIRNETLSAIILCAGFVYGIVTIVVVFT